MPLLPNSYQDVEEVLLVLEEREPRIKVISGFLLRPANRAPLLPGLRDVDLERKGPPNCHHQPFEVGSIHWGRIPTVCGKFGAQPPLLQRGFVHCVQPLHLVEVLIKYLVAQGSVVLLRDCFHWDPQGPKKHLEEASEHPLRIDHHQTG